jgi:hypothetical protein
VIELTSEQRQEIESGKAVDVADSESKDRLVILRRDVFENALRLAFSDSDWTDDEMRLLLARSSKENGWDEPGMEEYDRYDEELRQRCQ